MNQFDRIKTREDMEKPISQGGMSMGEGGKEVKGWPNSCPKSKREDGKHLVTVLSCVQSVEHYKCDYCGDEWYD